MMEGESSRLSNKLTRLLLTAVPSTVWIILKPEATADGAMLARATRESSTAQRLANELGAQGRRELSSHGRTPLLLVLSKSAVP